jgi:hypothetical protein
VNTSDAHILDSRMFTIRFADGEEKDIAYSILAEQLYSQVDSEGNQHCLFKEIFNHQRNKNALDKTDAYCMVSNGNRVPKKSTAGLDFKVEGNDGTTSWLPLKELKETNSVETDINSLIRNHKQSPKQTINQLVKPQSISSYKDGGFISAVNKRGLK